MTREEITKKVTEIIVKKLGVTEAEVKPEASYVEDLGADSLDQVELVMEFEDSFSLGDKIPEDEAAKLTTVGSTIDYLVNRLGK
ncbi:acyl carrier protein [bacterium]|nr:acyl carrier protein [bacterium]NUN46119.1 acyl carrier protein [bacterium]HMV26150.1 acyl carrier protein [bacterium]HMW32641.1 acyl carrier protein [bacterium]HMW35106.1 acyl carrier protein [bacterium]